MPFCSSCGVKNADSANFCKACGNMLTTTNSSVDIQARSEQVAPMVKKDNKLAEGRPDATNKSFFTITYHTLFVGNDIKKLWEAWLILVIIDCIISFGMYHLGIYSPPLEINLVITLLVWVGLMAAIIIPVRIAVIKRNAYIALGALICFVGLFLWTQTLEDTKEAYELAINLWFGGAGLKSKIYVIFLILWDQVLSTIFEFILLFRIYSVLNSTGEKG